MHDSSPVASWDSYSKSPLDAQFRIFMEDLICVLHVHVRQPTMQCVRHDEKTCVNLNVSLIHLIRLTKTYYTNIPLFTRCNHVTLADLSSCKK